MTKFLHNKFLVVYAIVLLVVLVLTGQLFSSTSFFIFIYLTALFFNLKLAVKAKSSLMTSPRVKTLFSLNVVFNVIAALISILALYSELILLPHAYLLSVSILLLSACYWQVHQSNLQYIQYKYLVLSTFLSNHLIVVLLFDEFHPNLKE